MNLEANILILQKVFVSVLTLGSIEDFLCGLASAVGKEGSTRRRHRTGAGSTQPVLPPLAIYGFCCCNYQEDNEDENKIGTNVRLIDNQQCWLRFIWMLLFHSSMYVALFSSSEKGRQGGQTITT